MLRFEDSLPRLPVPSLEETSRRYLKSVHAVVSESEYERTKKAVEEFIRPGGQGESLQKRLLARAADPKIKNGSPSGGTRPPTSLTATPSSLTSPTSTPTGTTASVATQPSALLPLPLLLSTSRPRSMMAPWSPSTSVRSLRP